jgi:D-alanyl-D-alanine carboxypeptidase/D-alanyl-D-alanine-endopeptidase (penicillin-binding protein 4)
MPRLWLMLGWLIASGALAGCQSVLHPCVSPQPVVMSWDIVSIDSGRRRSSHAADHPMTPASLMKLWTGHAALVIQGPKARHWTEWWVDRADPSRAWMRDGVLGGGLVWRFGGDPDLSMERLRSMVEDLAAMGLRRVTSLTIDTTAWSAARPESWLLEDWLRCYGAPAGPLVIERQCVGWRVDPSHPTPIRADHPWPPGKDETPLWQPGILPAGSEWAMQTSLRDARAALAGPRDASPPPALLRLAVQHPEGWLMKHLPAWLKAYGITVEQPIRLGRVPEGARLWSRVSSKPLEDWLMQLWHDSNNVIAELMVYGTDSARPASRQGGLDMMRRKAEGEGWSWPPVMVDGSGLSRKNIITARHATALLRPSEAPHFQPWWTYLPELGREGTVKSVPMEGVSGMFRAKSGSFSGVCHLAGYRIDPHTQRPSEAFALLIEGVVDREACRKRQHRWLRYHWPERATPAGRREGRPERKGGVE